MSEGHYILPVSTCVRVLGALLVMTVVTVAATKIDLGILNFPLAMLIATIKAGLVVTFFMGMKYDSNENRLIFFSSLIFVAIFIGFTCTDLLFRPEDSVAPVAGATQVSD